MEEKNKRPFGPQDGGQQRDRQPRRRGFSWFSMIYLILLLGLVYMWSSTGTANPLKKEWLDVKETLLVSGDVEKLVYVRNEHKGEIYLKQGALDKYKNLYGGREPKGGPHFYFLVSEKFDAEEQLDTLVESLPGDKQFKDSVLFQLTHRQASAVPVIEVSDETDADSIGSPYGKIHAGHSVYCHRMGSQITIDIITDPCFELLQDLLWKLRIK